MESIDKTFREWLSDVRRDFHAHPEVALQEKRTTERIKSILGEIGVECHGFEDMTGVVGLIRGSAPGKTLALRADMDALPVQESNDIPYRSSQAGVMHACGHDANVAIMLGVAKWAVDSGISQGMKGNIKFFFQPAEEGHGGAKRMIERGVLEDPHVDRVLAGHMGPELPVSTVGLYRDQGYASSDRFRLLLRGKGGHGGRPHQTIDPIVAGAYFVTTIQSVVARNVDPIDAAVITVGRFTSGQAGNVVPEHAELEGTIRALDSRVRDRLWQRIRDIADGIEKTFGIGCDLEFFEGYPSCTNDREVSAFLREISSDLLGADKVHSLPPTTGAEDFAYFALQRPSAIMRLGCGNKGKGLVHPLHSPLFDIDEGVLMVGVQIFSEAVKRYLA